MSAHPLYIFMLNLHLVRGREPGRDAGSGGQIDYALELARSLGGHPAVGRVELLTRLVDDPQVPADYARPEEPIGENATIIRLPFGPKRHLRQEQLWDHLDALVDGCLRHFKEQGRVPDVIHSHHADGGYVGRQLSRLLGVPQIHTAHSFGRLERQRLLDGGRQAQDVERQFNNLARRIEAEELALQNAELVIASSRQERDEQYGLYENFQPARCLVLPPGVDSCGGEDAAAAGPRTAPELAGQPGWNDHAEAYVYQLRRLAERGGKGRAGDGQGRPPLLRAQWLLLSGIDDDSQAEAPGPGGLDEWPGRKEEEGLAFGVATGRSLDSALKALRRRGAPVPDVLVAAAGTEIYYGQGLSRDEGWTRHIQHHWRRAELARALDGLPGLRLQRVGEQGEFKLSFLADPEQMPTVEELGRHLRAWGLEANLVFSHDRYLDVLPARASQSQALRYLAAKWGLPLRRFLVAGDSGEGLERMAGDTLGAPPHGRGDEPAAPGNTRRARRKAGRRIPGIVEGMGRHGFGAAAAQP